MSSIYLSDQEIRDITDKVHKGKQREVLEFMGYKVKIRPDGSFWVPKAQFMESTVIEAQKKHKLNLQGITRGKAA